MFTTSIYKKNYNKSNAVYKASQAGKLVCKKRKDANKVQMIDFVVLLSALHVYICVCMCACMCWVSAWGWLHMY